MQSKLCKYSHFSYTILVTYGCFSFLACTHTEQVGEMKQWAELKKIEEADCDLIDPDPFLQQSEIRTLGDGKKVIFLKERNSRTVVEWIDRLDNWSPEEVVGLRLPREELPISLHEQSGTVVTAKELTPTSHEVIFRSKQRPVEKFPWPSSFRHVWPESGSGYLLADDSSTLIGLGPATNLKSVHQHVLKPKSFDEPYLFFTAENKSIALYISAVNQDSQALWISQKDPKQTSNSLKKTNINFTNVSEWGAGKINDGTFIIWSIKGDSFSGDAQWGIYITKLITNGAQVNLSVERKIEIPIGEVNVGTPVIVSTAKGAMKYLGWLENEKVLYKVDFSDLQNKIRKIGYISEEGASLAAWTNDESTTVIQKKVNGLNVLGLCKF